MLDCLKALPTRRRQAIKDVIVLYDYMNGLQPALTVLSSCQGLRHLTIDITLLAHCFENQFANTFDQAPGYNELIALRGLDSLTITYGEDGSTWDLVLDILKRIRHFPVTNINEIDVRQEIALLEARVNLQVKLPPNDNSLPTEGELAQAMSHSSVVDGNILRDIAPPQTATTLVLQTTNTHGQSSLAAWPRSSQDGDWGQITAADSWDNFVTEQTTTGLQFHKRLLLSIRAAL